VSTQGCGIVCLPLGGLWTASAPDLGARLRSRRMDIYDDDADYFIDENGCLGEVRDLGGTKLVIHYDDIPESEKTVVDGIIRARVGTRRFARALERCRYV